MRFSQYKADWKKLQIKDISYLVTKGTTPPYFSLSGVNYVKIDSIVNNKIDPNKLMSIDTKIHITNLKRSILHENDVLLAIAGATIGKHALVPKDILPANTNQALAIIRTNNRDISEYLLTIFDTNKLKDYIKNICASSAQPNLNLKQVEEFEFYIPENNERMKLMNLISKINERIETQIKIINEYSSLMKAISSLFFSKTEIKKQLSEICVINKGQQINGENLLENGQYYVMNGGTSPSGYLNIYNKEANIISISEGGNSCGYVQFNNDKFWSGGHCYTIENVKPTINNKYLYYYLKFYESKIMNLRIGTGLPNIQKKDLEQFKVIIPNIKIQIQITNILDCIETKINIEKELLSLYQLQKSYLLKNMFA